jgi:hypothetical protein
VKSKSIYWKYVLLKIKYISLRDSYVCTRWIFIFDSDQAQINSAGWPDEYKCALSGMEISVKASDSKSDYIDFFIYRRPTLYPLEIGVDFFKSP